MTRSDMQRTRGAILAFLVGLAVAVSAAPEALAQGCTIRAKTPAAITVFDRAPEATTGRGFVYGAQTINLPAQSQFYVCREITVGFGLVTQKWAQIAIWQPARKEWRNGWVRSERLVLGEGPAAEPGATALRLIPQARAAAQAPAAWDKAAPQPGPASAKAPVVAAEQAGPQDPAAQAVPSRIPENLLPPAPPPEAQESGMSTNSMWLQVQFVLILTVAVLLGILAQGAYELFDSDERLSRKGVLKLFVRPLLVSPIVLLIFLGTVDLNISQWKQALILALLAFQAGFCWQKALERAASPKPRADSQR